MEIILTTKEIEDIFFPTLKVGLYYLQERGFTVDYDEQEYIKAKEQLKISKPDVFPLYTDVLIQLLKNENDLFIKEEDKPDIIINLNTIYTNIPNIPNHILSEVITEKEDDELSDIVSQTVFFSKVIFESE